MPMCIGAWAGEQRQGLGWQLMMLEHQAGVTTATDITDAGPGASGAG